MFDISLLESAERFILSYQDIDQIDRNILVHQTTNYLINQYSCSLQTASLYAACAVANIESKGIDAYVDIDQSTSNCVFVRQKGQLRAFSIRDLVKCLENESQIT